MATRSVSTSSIGSTGGIGLQTSGKILREMLEKSGARHQLVGAEKLDFLVWLSDQVMYCIENRRKMMLRFEDLTEFLAREHISEAGVPLDAKGAVSGLLALRTRELSRLRYDESRLKDLQSADARFELALVEMEDNDVTGCFQGPLVVYEDGKAVAPSSSLPGQVSSPRAAEKRSSGRARPESLREAGDGGGDSAPDADPAAQRRSSSSSGPPPPRSPSQYTLPPGVPPPPSCPPPPSLPSPSSQTAVPVPAKKRCTVM